MQKQHEMVLAMTHSSGAEEWYCPTCERRMSITWHPWRRIILEKGDIHAAHRASQAGPRVRPVGVLQDPATAVPTEAESLVEDPYLEPWQRWLDTGVLDDLWDSEGD
jgi:hypothetical protein